MDERVELIRDHREEIGLNACCQALGVSKGTWHYREKRRRAGPDPEEERLKAEVETIIADHPAYGYRRIRPELEARTRKMVNHKRPRRLLNEWDLSLTREVSRPEPSGVWQTLDRASGGLNLVADWEPKPMEMLSTDVTKIHYANGARKAYLIAAVDPVSSWVAGWAVGPSPNRELALTAWQRVQESLRAVDRSLARVVVHQDQDAVFTSYDWFEALLVDVDVVVSYPENGAKGNPWVESFWARFKAKNASLIGTAGTLAELREVIGAQMRYYNRQRRHSGIDYRSPVEFLRAAGRLSGNLGRNWRSTRFEFSRAYPCIG